MTLELSTALALVGTALTAFAILAPRPVPASVPRMPGHAPPTPRAEPWPTAPEPEVTFPPFAVPVPSWPALLDRRASGLDEPARAVLVEALGTVGAEWARAILRRALDDESDPALRDAIRRELRG